ncbi:MAG: hypothetical protein KJ726_07410 [Verrucomicrobia bacterium]|nr:hypothetical protein [Verrucomicrobiota bacterium]
MRVACTVAGMAGAALLSLVIQADAEDPTRYMDFNDWPDSGTNLGAHTHLSWTVQTGRVWDVDAYEGKSALLPGSAGTTNYIQSPFFSNGYGTISFEYARGTNGYTPAQLGLQSSADGTNWTTLDVASNFAGTAYRNYSRFYFHPAGSYLRICNLTNTLEDCVCILLDEGFADGINPPPGWTFTGISSSYFSLGNYGREPPSLKFDNTGDQIITPHLDQPTNLVYWLKGQVVDSNSYLLVEATPDDIAWTIVASNCPIANQARTNSYALASNIIRVRFTYGKSQGNLAFDDVIIQGMPCPPGALQDLRLDQINIETAELQRVQNFDNWPTEYAYGYYEYKGWSVSNALIDTFYAYSGQTVRLRDGTDSKYVLSPFLPDGLGLVSFRYRHWDGTNPVVAYALQTSPDGLAWTDQDTVSISSATYSNYSRFFNISNGVYVRLLWISGEERVLFDEISLGPFLESAPEIPQGLTASDGEDLDCVRLNWSDVAEEAGYAVWRNVSNTVETASIVGASGADGTNYNDFTALPGQLCYYWVTAMNALGTSDWSNVDDGYRRLATPTNFTASEGTYPDKVMLTWDDTLGETGFGLWRHPDNDTNAASCIGGVGADTLTFDDTTAVPGQGYYYWVRASNLTSSSMSDFSACAVGYRAQDPTAPDATIIGLAMDSNITIFTFGNTGAIPWSIQPYFSTNLPEPALPWQPILSFNQTLTDGTNAVSFALPAPTNIPIFYRMLFTKP